MQSSIDQRRNSNKQIKRKPNSISQREIISLFSPSIMLGRRPNSPKHGATTISSNNGTCNVLKMYENNSWISSNGTNTPYYQSAGITMLFGARCVRDFSG